MPQQKGSLETIAISLARLLRPLEERLDAGEVRFLFAELGLQFPPVLETIPSFTGAAGAVVSTVKQMPGLVADLAAAIQSENIAQILIKGVELINLIRAAIQGIEKLATELKDAGAATGLPADEVTQFANQLPGRLIEYLVSRNIESLPAVAESLEFIGALEKKEENVGSTDPAKPPFTKRAIHIDQLTNFLESPLNHLQAKYGWGSPSFDGLMLLQALQRLLTRTGVPAILDTSVSPPVLDVLFVEVSPKTDITPRGLQIKIADTVRIDNAAPFAQDDWKVELALNTQLSVGSQVIIQPNDNITFIPTSDEVKGEAFLRWTGGKEDGQPYLILGQVGGSRVEAKQLVAKLGVGFAWDSSNNRANGDLKISAEVRKGKVVISLGQADGFLGKILSDVGLESDFDVGLGFSTKDGIFFYGSTTLEIQLPIHITLGPVEISALTIIIGIQGTVFPISLSADIKTALGPLQAVVEQIGLIANLSLPPNRKGNAGPVDFSLDFKPPKGVGLSLDAGVIKGGGFLRFDPERKEYFGELELVFKGTINLKAIGLITTRMPDGSDGFSLLIIITAKFGTGIQLGFGFTLLEVGGLIGLNRTVKLPALIEGVRTGAINSIMFPENPVANAPRIISDLRAFFPPEEGKFLIGPMAKIAWGTPPLITISLGVIIEIPGNITIVGVLRMILPDDKTALLVLQVNFVGVIEFDKKRFFLFAALFDSRVLSTPLGGEMGVLMAFGDDANFIVTVGGFHPRYNPPPLPFPTPRRVSLDIINTSAALIRLDGYFALTTNSAQFGARAELRFGFDDFGIQGHLGFDALLQFSPFHFIVEIKASVSLKAFGVGTFSIRLRFSLEGPAPYRARGTGSLSIFWVIDISVDFDETWGESRNTTLPPIDVLPRLKAEFEKIENWRALPPAGNNLLVSLRKLDPVAELVLHPVGTLRISQKAVPLDLKIDRVGNQKVNDANRFSLEVTSDGLSKLADITESFALGQYQNLDDAKRLSQRAYEKLKGGLEISVKDGSLKSSKMVKRVVRYEEIIIDTNFKRFIPRLFTIAGGLFNHFLQGASVSKSVLSQAHRLRLDPFAEKIEIKAEGFVVAFQANNIAFNAQATFTSEAQAHDYLGQQIALDPNLADSLHVIPRFEAAP